MNQARKYKIGLLCAHQSLSQLSTELRGSVFASTILGGSGQVDVSLVRGKERIACEISVTTSKDHELGNVEKCIAAGYRHILLIGRTAKQVSALGKFIERNLDDGSGARIDCIAKEDLPGYLDGLELPPPSESTVRGIKVKRRYTRVSPEDRAIQRQAIARVTLETVKQKKKKDAGQKDRKPEACDEDEQDDR